MRVTCLAQAQGVGGWELPYKKDGAGACCTFRS